MLNVGPVDASRGEIVDGSSVNAFGGEMLDVGPVDTARGKVIDRGPVNALDERCWISVQFTPREERS